LFRLQRRTREAVMRSGVAGEIHDHSAKIVQHAISRMLAGDPYFALGVTSIAKAAGKRLDENIARTWVAESLGISLKRFQKAGPSYIDPNLTINRLEAMMDEIDSAILQDKRILLATGHPGSMLQFYLRLEHYIRDRQERPILQRIDKTWKVAESMWVDCVESVALVSDLGSLVHTHDTAPMEAILHRLKSVDLVIADHGFAGAAINLDIRTVGLHDVDDPAIPVAERLGLNVLAVPINDNQRNLRTDEALEAVIQGR
jgi:hypothetical protein